DIALASELAEHVTYGCAGDAVEFGVLGLVEILVGGEFERQYLPLQRLVEPRLAALPSQFPCSDARHDDPQKILLGHTTAILRRCDGHLPLPNPGTPVQALRASREPLSRLSRRILDMSAR